MNYLEIRWVLPAVGALAVMAYVLVVPAGCAQVLGIVTDRYVVEAGASDGVGDEGDAGPWGCLSNPPETLDPSENVAVSVLVYDPTKSITNASAVDGGSDLVVVSYTPIPGVSVTACPLFSSSATCGAGAQLTNDAGIAQFNLNGGFNGYFLLTGPTLVPSSFYPGQLVTGLTEATDPTVMLNYATASALGESLGVPVALDAGGTLGNVIMSIFDCNDRHGAGVVFTLSQSITQTLLYYISDGLPSTTATETTNYGTGGANNVPQGSLTITATLSATAKPLGTAVVSISPGQYTYAWIRARTH
jgi:hypothetical protein